MIIDSHSHHISADFFDDLEKWLGTSREIAPSGLHLLRKGNTSFMPFRPEWSAPDHILKDMDRKGIDMRVLTLSTPSIYIFDEGQQVEHSGSASPTARRSMTGVTPTSPGRGSAHPRQ